MNNSYSFGRALAVTIVVAWAGASTGVADMVDPATVRRDDTGPPSPHGETPAEIAAKKVAFERNYTSLIERKGVEAFAKYVSADYCDHGHLGTGGQSECATPEYLQQRLRRPQQPLEPGEKIEMPAMATANGDLVAMFGAGIDIMRVRNGQVTDHWDASPPAEVALYANARGFPDWGVITSAAQGRRGKRSIGRPTNRQMLTAVDAGPITPYAETRQEAANKRLVFSFVFNAYVLGNFREAVEKYVGADFCDHSHLVGGANAGCGTRDELLARGGQVRPARLGDRIEIPFMASVDGEMVTTYSDSADIFQVHDGRITDHWDAVPPRNVIVHAHATVVPDHLIKVVNGELPFGSPGPPGAGSFPVAK